MPASIKGDGAIKEAISELNKQRTMATFQDFYPLLTDDLHPEFKRSIFPSMLPHASSHGVVIIGKAGRGKTQVFSSCYLTQQTPKWP